MAEPDMTPPEDGPPPPPSYEPPQEPELPPAPGEEQEDDDDVKAPEVDAEEELEPKSDPVLRVIIDERGKSGEYVQKTLTYFGKIQLYGLLARAVTVLIESDIGLNEILDMAQPQTMLEKLVASMPGAGDVPDADTDPEIDAAKMMSAFAKVVSIAPDMIMEAYCIVLNIPVLHRKWAMEWGLPNIDDELGWDIAHTFFDQNWGVLEDFFAQEMPKMFRRAARARAAHRSAGAR